MILGLLFILTKFRRIWWSWSLQQSKHWIRVPLLYYNIEIVKLKVNQWKKTLERIGETVLMQNYFHSCMSLSAWTGSAFIKIWAKHQMEPLIAHCLLFSQLTCIFYTDFPFTMNNLQETVSGGAIIINCCELEMDM